MEKYIIPENAKIEEKHPKEAEIFYAKQEKVYTQEEVLAILKQLKESGVENYDI